ncbi:MAG: hypothetical protein SFV51_04865 [Bryobacteraceae bacterium]|nr:hypothetical protein [Bryobacteraceae bacterium]
MNRRNLFLFAFPLALASALAAKDEATIAKLEAELKKNPKDAKVKTALGDAYFAHGEAQMFDDKLPPFRKYPAALRAFRKTAELNPNHKKAKEHIATIEGIYKSMGREVPK